MKTKNIGLAILGTLLVALLVTSLAKNYVASGGQTGFLASVVNLFTGGGSSDQTTTGTTGPMDPNRILVKFKPGTAANLKNL